MSRCAMLLESARHRRAELDIGAGFGLGVEEEVGHGCDCFGRIVNDLIIVKELFESVALVRGPDGKIYKRPVQERSDTHKVTDYVKDRLSGLLIPKKLARDVSKDYYYQKKKEMLKSLGERKKA